MLKYSRKVVMTWNPDSRSERTDAVDSICQLMRELVQVQIYDKNSDEEFRWNGEWVIPAECIDEEAWLDFAIEMIEKLGHEIDWFEGEPGFDKYSKCIVHIKGGEYPHLLGRLW